MEFKDIPIALPEGWHELDMRGYGPRYFMGPGMEQVQMHRPGKFAAYTMAPGQGALEFLGYLGEFPDLTSAVWAISLTKGG